MHRAPGGSPNKNRPVERHVERQVERQVEGHVEGQVGVLLDVLPDVQLDDFYLDTPPVQRGPRLYETSRSYLFLHMG